VTSTSEHTVPLEAAPEPNDERQATLVRAILLGELTPEEVCAQEGLTSEELTEWIKVHRRAARRAIEDQMAATLSAHGLAQEDFVLSGDLERMSLSDLLEAIQLGRKNAHIRVEHGGEYSHLWCSDGDVIDAESGSLVGTRAVYRLLALQEGRLQAEFTNVLRDRTVVASTEALLIDGARRLDECKMLRRQLGDSQRVCVPSTADATGSELEPLERELLQAFDGTRSIDDVIAASRQPELETLHALQRLLAERHVVVLFPLEPSLPAASAELPASLIPPSQVSVPAIAPSRRAGSLAPQLARRYGPLGAWASALLLVGFATGLWSSRPTTPAPSSAAPGPALALGQLASALCGPDMALLPAGVGTPSATDSADAPLRPFCLSARVVSTEEYQTCVSSQHCEPAQTESAAGPGEKKDDSALRCNAGQPGRERAPINCVTQRQAEQYCEWRGQRLPLPGEWEFAWHASRSAPATPAGAVPEAGMAVLGDLSEWTRAHPRPRRGAELETDPPHYAVSSVESISPTSVRPKRLYMSASAHGRSIGFRCATGLEPSAALSRAEPTPPGAP
jgi:hypothetical protein